MALIIKVLLYRLNISLNFHKIKFLKWISILSVCAIFLNGFWIYSKNYGEVDSLKKNQEIAFKSLAPLMTKTKKSNLDIIIYIGESTSSFHQSLYGYFRNTNAPLEKNKDNITVFTDVTSAHSHTAPSLLRALTLSNNPLKDPFIQDKDLLRPNVIEMLNWAEYNTVWLSNQNVAGTWDSASQLFGRMANDSEFLNFAIANQYKNDTKIYDTDLISLLTKKLEKPTQKPTAFFLHSYAGHWDYCKNIPPQDQKEYSDLFYKQSYKAIFGNFKVTDEKLHKKNIDCYDSAMEHISTNINSVIELAKNRERPTVVIYFSDHGEDVFGNTGHDSSKHNSKQIYIPFYVYFNDNAKKESKEIYEFMIQNKDRSMNLSWLSDSIVDLAGISIEKFRKSLSIFKIHENSPSHRYSLLRTSIRGEDQIVSIDKPNLSDKNLKDISDDFLQKKKLLKSMDPKLADKICAHRVNSFLKFFEASKIFNCIETDIVIDLNDKELYVYHPPAKNNQLTLKTLLTANKSFHGRMWLDIKNLSSENGSLLLEYLNSIFPPDLRKNILIETDSVPTYDPLLEATLLSIRNSGYKLSYYLPTKNAMNCNNKNNEFCENFKMDVNHAFKIGIYTNLSFDILALNFVEKLKIPEFIELNLWDDSMEKTKIDKEILKRTDMFIIPYKSKFDY